MVRDMRKQSHQGSTGQGHTSAIFANIVALLYQTQHLVMLSDSHLQMSARIGIRWQNTDRCKSWDVLFKYLIVSNSFSNIT